MINKIFDRMDKKSGFFKKMIFSLLLLFSSGCGSPFWGGEQNDSDSYITELYYDNFSDSASGWPTISGPEAAISYQYDGLRFVINRPNYDYWSAPVNNYKNVRISVVSAKLGGPDDNGYGIICRLNDTKNFYGFLISSDGYAGILKAKDGNISILSGEEMQYFEVIQQDSTRNDLEAGCIGALLTLDVNGVRILEAVDHDYPMGRAGLMVSTGGTVGVDIFFDDFKVSNP